MCWASLAAQSVAATKDVALAVDFIQQRFADELAGFDVHHHGVKDLLSHLSHDESSHHVGRQRRSVADCFLSIDDGVQYCRRLQLITSNHHHPRRHQLSSAVRSLYIVSFYSASTLLAMQSAVLARGILSVCLSVCPSATIRYCVQRNEDTIVRFSASGRTIPLVSSTINVIKYTN